MTVIALPNDRLTLVSLVSDERSPLLDRLLQAPSFHAARHVPVKLEKDTQRKVTAARIDAAITEAESAVLLVAQGVGCIAAAWWARLSPQSYVGRVAGALMIAPQSALVGSEGFAAPRVALPFPSIVVGMDDASQQLAGEWGSRLIDGPLPLGSNATSNRFQSIIARFTSAIVDSDVRAAERLIAALGDR